LLSRFILLTKISYLPFPLISARSTLRRLSRESPSISAILRKPSLLRLYTYTFFSSINAISVLPSPSVSPSASPMIAVLKFLLFHTAPSCVAASPSPAAAGLLPSSASIFPVHRVSGCLRLSSGVSVSFLSAGSSSFLSPNSTSLTRLAKRSIWEITSPLSPVSLKLSFVRPCATSARRISVLILSPIAVRLPNTT